MPQTIQYWEKCTIDGWPSLETIYLDTWQLRFAKGYTNRANAVFPLGHIPSGEVLNTRVIECEQAYARHKLPAIFKLAAYTFPDFAVQDAHQEKRDQAVYRLDRALSTRDYAINSYSYLMTCNLRATTVSEPYATTLQHIYRATPEIDLAWFHALLNWSQNIRPYRDTAYQLLTQPTYPLHFAAMYKQNVPAAVGLGVLQPDSFGIYDVMTDPDQRRQGLAKALIGEMLNWARMQGIPRAYLQVSRENIAAIALYSGLGFRIEYGYWYRVKRQLDY